MKRTLSHIGICAVLVLALLMSGPQPAQARGDGSTETAVAVSIASVIVGTTLGYLVWANRPNNPNPVDWSVRGPGGFYVGGFVGGSFVPGQAWRVDGRSGGLFSLPYSVNTDKVKFRPSMVGGVKLGYFFHKFPNFGVEGEFNYSRNSIDEQHVTISPPLVNAGNLPNPVLGTRARIPTQTLAVMTLAMHFMGRVGFIKTEEVPFGILQPYVGIGPGFVILYGDQDAAKNFSLEGVAGVRCMLRKNLSLFAEYNISQQWKVELEEMVVRQPANVGGFEQRGKATFNFQKHHFVVGLCYHFL